MPRKPSANPVVIKATERRRELKGDELTRKRKSDADRKAQTVELAKIRKTIEW